jgi:tRNA-splicing ligase RtcB (3'-phosphate/5'-hydroxy nucleic acid ligase)
MYFLNEKTAVWGEHDEGTIAQIQRASSDEHVVRAALEADGHKGFGVPVGGVLAYTDSISPSGVGFDIGCGNLAVRLDIPATEVQKSIKTIMDDVVRNIAFGIGRKNDTRVDDPLFDLDAWKIDAVAPHKEMARSQLGTVGSGNHFVDIFVDEQNRTWVGVHFGSRGLGHKTATYFLKAGGAIDGIDTMPLVIPVDSSLGAEYLACMCLAGRYAYAGRNWVCSEVSRIIGANIIEEVHNHHNFAWREEHNGQGLWVVRKGATPAFPGQKSFIGGSMGDNSVIIEGVENDNAKYSLYSTVHGAGRVMSRTQARGKMNYKTHQIISGGMVSKDMMMEWVNGKCVELRGADVDESPHCYKRLDEVLKHHADSIKILHTLVPIGVAMADRRDFDPYHD